VAPAVTAIAAAAVDVGAACSAQTFFSRCLTLALHHWHPWTKAAAIG